MDPGGRALSAALVLVLAGALHAVAAAPEPPAVDIAAGRDLDAWRELHARRQSDTEAVPALQEFVARFPSSPLAELAWARLEAASAGPATLALHPHLAAWVPWWERSLAAHREALQRSTVAVAVAPLEPDGTPRLAPASRWLAGVSGGVGFDGQHPWGGVGFRVEYRVLGVVGRVGWADRGFAQFGARLGVPSTLPVGRHLRPLAGFGELSVRTDGRLSLLAGGRLVLDPKWWLEATAGASWRARRFGPAVAVEAVFSL